MKSWRAQQRSKSSTDCEWAQQSARQVSKGQQHGKRREEKRKENRKKKKKREMHTSSSSIEFFDSIVFREVYDERERKKWRSVGYYNDNDNNNSNKKNNNNKREITSAAFFFFDYFQCSDDDDDGSHIVLRRRVTQQKADEDEEEKKTHEENCRVEVAGWEKKKLWRRYNRRLYCCSSVRPVACSVYKCKQVTGETLKSEHTHFKTNYKKEYRERESESPRDYQRQGWQQVCKVIFKLAVPIENRTHCLHCSVRCQEDGEQSKQQSQLIADDLLAFSFL